MKILIVDDEQQVCQNIASKIRRLNIVDAEEIYTANTVKDAEILYDEYHPELVFTDIRIPVTSGIVLIERLREKKGKCAIFAVSGYDDYQYVREAFLAGADDYILKPISIGELKDKLIKAAKRIGFKTNSPSEEESEFHDTREQMEPLVERAIEYINLNYTHSLTLAEVADSMSVSYSHFSHIFKKSLGVTFPAYLLKIRMEKAIAYLDDPDFSITQVAEKTGYQNVNHFSRAFKHYTGKSPSEYRNQPEKEG